MLVTVYNRDQCFHLCFSFFVITSKIEYNIECLGHTLKYFTVAGIYADDVILLGLIELIN